MPEEVSPSSRSSVSTTTCSAANALSGESELSVSSTTVPPAATYCRAISTVSRR
ncbi:hypothetical protein AB3K78_03380 [Leucobacter sp. HNU]|uniref:hypothetical protein n=1 Tax=Leucobacter sp. HNU TaxID=3236805 RepID=UPI003A80A058